MTISVIIPVHNSQNALGHCLSALNDSHVSPFELIVVDDSSTDSSVEIARSFSASVVQLTEHSNPNHCRNIGAQQASGEILLFLDSDVVVFPDTLQKIITAFGHNSADAVVGVYSARHRHSEIASQYKNLWIRHSYLISGPKLDWLFGAVAAVKREVFFRAGGFNRTFFFNKGGDLEFGKRMSAAKFIISLEPSIEVEHLRCHTLRSLMKNDLERSDGFVELALQLGQVARAARKGFANIYPAFIYGCVLAVLLPLALVAMAANVSGWSPSALIGSVWLILNAPFLLFFSRHNGPLKTLPATGILFLDQLTCSFGIVKGVFRWIFRN